MRTWARVPIETVCGGCGHIIRTNQPALTLALAGVKKIRVRCEECDGPAPPGLPEHIATDAPTLDNWDGMRKLTKQFGGKIWKRG
jgi:hypothetical protein